MKKSFLSFLLLLAAAFAALHAQDTLPKFKLTNVGNNRIIVGWTNTFETIKQISIQRSFDSLQGYKSILTVADPTTQQNGYVDTKATNDHMFYRLYILLDKGVYIFSEAKKPVRDTTSFFPTNGNYTGGDPLTDPNFGSKGRPPGFIPSLYVFTHRDGNVQINLPAKDKPKKYSIKFYEEDKEFLFELKDIKERTVKLDKTIFYHAGWFLFELYDDDRLVEMHKFYLDKDFNPVP